MGNERDYLSNLHEFDKWLKANAILCSIFTIGSLAMVLILPDQPWADRSGLTALR